MSAPQRVPVHRVIDHHGPVAPLLALESSWPASRAAYREGLRALAAALRTDEYTQIALYRWFQREFVGLLQCRDPDERTMRKDALVDIVCSGWGAEGLDKAADGMGWAQPNLRSWLRAKLIWRGNDLMESRHRRHARHVPSAHPDMLGAARLQLSPHRVADRILTVRKILTSYPLTKVERAALEKIANGTSVAETARRTGRSRQQIYRLFERIRRWEAGR